MAQPDHYITKPKDTIKPAKKPDLGDEIIKSIVSKLPADQKEKLARLFGIKYNPKITNPDYKGNPKDINPNWKPN